MKSIVSGSLLKGAVLWALFSGSILAHEGATGIVSERMDAMSEMGDATKAVAAMLKGEIDFDAGAIASNAQLLVSHGEQIVELFPDTTPSRSGAKTESLPDIWDRPDEFAKMAEEMTQSARDLEEVARDRASDPKTVKIAFSRVAQSCKACHRDFRKPSG